MIIEILTKDIELLTEYNNLLYIINLKKTIKLYSELLILMKISNCDYISFFTYDYSKKYVAAHFLISIDNTGNIVKKGMLEDFPVASNFLTMNILSSDDKDLYCSFTEDALANDTYIYNVLTRCGLNKIYYQNVFRDETDNPVGFIAFTYKDKEYVISDDDKFEIIRIINIMKKFI